MSGIHWSVVLAIAGLLTGATASADEKNAIPLPALTETAQEGSEAAAGTSITAGTRVNFEGRGYSFVPPKGWERGSMPAKAGLLFQMPRKPGEYQKTIQVLSFKGAVSWDDYNFQQFRKYIVNRFGSKSDLISNYMILNYEPFKLDNGQPAIIYYATFNFGDMKMMQMHVLVSSTSRHFLTTFTDLASNFGAGSVPEALRPVYDAIRTIQVEGGTTSAVQKTIGVVAALVGLLVLFFLVRSLTQWVKFNRLKKLESEAPEAMEADKAEEDPEPQYSEAMEHHLAEQHENQLEGDDVPDLDFEDHRNAS